MTIAKHIKILFYESASFKFKIFVISKFEPFGMQYSSQREDKSQIRSIYRFNFCSDISVILSRNTLNVIALSSVYRQMFCSYV